MLEKEDRERILQSQVLYTLYAPMPIKDDVSDSMFKVLIPACLHTPGQPHLHTASPFGWLLPHYPGSIFLL